MRPLMLLMVVWMCCTISHGQSDLFIPIANTPTSTSPSAKPQSKVWEFNDEFYSVFPNGSGTYIWTLSGNQWTEHLQLSSKTSSKADCFAISDTVFILLFQGANSEYTSVKYNEGLEQYEFLNTNTNVSNISFHSSVETATLAFDNNSTLWLSYESSNDIIVRNSTSPFETWSAEEIIETGVNADDICAIVKMNNSVGVLWSNQNSELFGFKYHMDGDLISIWSNDESPAVQSALNIGGGMADDHLNIKCVNNELYAVIKTSYDNSQYTNIGLLIRRSNGIWDSDLYHVSFTGTRPSLAIDTASHSLKVYYTSPQAGGDIMLRESSMDSIEFNNEILFLDGNAYNNTSTTKFPYNCKNVVIAAGTSNLVGNFVQCQCPNCEIVDKTVRVENADLYITSTSKGLILRSINDKCWKFIVSTSGDLITIEIPCPD